MPPIRIIDRGATRLCAFRKHCAACHTINGEGDGKSPELNYPASVVEYISPRIPEGLDRKAAEHLLQHDSAGTCGRDNRQGKNTEELIAISKR
ncbi:c-type cytochrome [Nitrosospira briensis]|uniref:c-type cytochrome n=1 Tax=Nitrosospira briensis TaxID=35799 RepID=UPI00210D5683|nr:c-type cytochrome [Nitrosospira briensis]